MLVRVVLDRLRRDEERRRCFLVRRSLRDERGHPTFVPRQLGDRVASASAPSAPHRGFAPRLLRPRRGSNTLESATGFDFEDGSLADGAITWSIDGAPTGHGAVVVVRLGAQARWLPGERSWWLRGAYDDGGRLLGWDDRQLERRLEPSSTNPARFRLAPIVTPPPSQFPPPTPARTLQALGGASATPVRSSSSRWPTRNRPLQLANSGCEPAAHDERRRDGDGCERVDRASDSVPALKSPA